jgi:hypothetical protein
MYQIFKDFSAPIATIIAAIGAVCVTAYFAWHQKNIAKEQADIARNKLCLDLYDRRFEIFSSIFDFYDAMISWKGTPEQQEARKRFFRAYQESCFLFTKESGIEALLKMLNDEGLKVIGFKENSDHYKSDPKLMIEQLKKTADIQTWIFEDGLARLKAAIHPYLDFSKVL